MKTSENRKFCGLSFTSMQVLYKLWPEKNLYFTIQSQCGSMEKPRFGQGKSFRLRACNYDGSIYSPPSSPPLLKIPFLLPFFLFPFFCPPSPF